MPLPISTGQVIPDSELTLSFTRASGPGGQNVNKVASAVQLRFDLEASTVLSETAKERLRTLAGRRLTDEGAILILARNHRTQERNRSEAFARLRELIERALVEPKARRPTRPPRAARERRLAGKAHAARRRQLRGRVRWED